MEFKNKKLNKTVIDFIQSESDNTQHIKKTETLCVCVFIFCIYNVYTLCVKVQTN